jgi:L-ascorbate metabolism protein UlaG (beta-lactamase superfamily)
VAPTHGHFDHVGDDLVDLIELGKLDGATMFCSHEMSLYLAALGVEAIGMNAGGRVEAAGIALNMVRADHTGGATLTKQGPGVTREMGCWGWVLEFEDGTIVYHSGDTDVFGDMGLIGQRFHPSVAVVPIGGHYTMDPVGAARAVDLVGAAIVIPVHYGTFPVLVGTPDQLRQHTSAEVVVLEPGETWER